MFSPSLASVAAGSALRDRHRAMPRHKSAGEISLPAVSPELFLCWTAMLGALS